MSVTPAPPPLPPSSDPRTAADRHPALEVAADVVDDVAERVLEPVDREAMEALDAPRRMVLVHAHPDDETIVNGATMARYAASGAHVTLLTCTRGEQGEVIPPELAHLAADADDTLGPHRVGELAAAMEALGVRDHRFLGDDEDPPVVYRDSGMVWGPDGRPAPAPDARGDAFALADLHKSSARLVRVLREVRPQVLVTYEPGGGYGHPDHVRAHHVAMLALDLAADPGHGVGEPWETAKVYWSVLPEDRYRTMLAASGGEAAEPRGGRQWERGGPVPSMVVPPEMVTTAVDATDQLDAKLAAMRAHATQIVVRGTRFALSSGPLRPVAGVEYYRLVRGRVAGALDRDGRETDLFAGVAPGE